MMFPEGLLCHQGSVYVAAPPQIWKLTDVDRDGVADRREVWFDGQTLTGCANDLHGPYLGRDGWIYWCKGAFAEQTYTLPDGREWTTRAAHIFRRRVRGGPIEPVMTGGMDNPVDVTFLPTGERFFTTTFLQHPAGGQRDGVIHAVYGGVYGKSHSVLDGHPRTGDLMPVLSHLGPAAPCGLTCLDGEFLGAEFDGNLVSCAFNLHQLTRHVLVADEATFRSSDSVLLASPDLDFHPTDVVQDADGSLVVLDTGGWYKLCCPTSQLHKPDVLGGIYRLRRAGGSSVVDARGQKIDWQHATDEQLVSWLHDRRHVVRRRAVETLAERGATALPVLQAALGEANPVRVRRLAVWAACQMESSEAAGVLELALQDDDASVRQTGLHAISVRRDQTARDAVRRCLADPDAAVRRVAAEAAGRLGDESAIVDVLEQMQYAQGRVLQHSLIYALIELDKPSMLRTAWEQSTPTAQRAILVALDQMPGGNLESGWVIGSLASSDERLRQTASWIMARHGEWARPLGDFVLGQLPQLASQPEVAHQLLVLFAPFLADADVQSRIAKGLNGAAENSTVRRLLLQCVQDYPGQWLSSDLQRVLAEQLSSLDADTLAKNILTVGAHPRKLQDPLLIARLLEVAMREDVAIKLRLQAIHALQNVPTELPMSLIQLTLETALDEEEFELRRLATEALSSAQLTSDQLQVIIEAFPSAEPVELGQLILVLKQTRDPSLARLALQRLAESEAVVVLPDSLLREAFADFDDEIKQGLESLLQKRLANQPDQAERLGELLHRLPDGDIRRGQQVFHSSKAACFTCHAMGYRGGDIGPDLTRIGRIRTRRDLLEAIVFPSLSFVRSYEPLSITTKAGLTIQGVVKDENTERLLLVNDQRKFIEVARADIELAAPGRVSVMPSGLDQLLSEGELADLLAFLEAAR